MTLRKKTLVIIGATLLGLILLLYGTAQSILLDSFAHLEAQEAREDAERASNALMDELAALQTTTGDYAHWDDTYSFVQDGNADYIETNLLDETFASLQLNIMVFLNNNGQIVFSRAYDPNQNEEDLITQEFQAELTSAAGRLFLSSELSAISGILVLVDRPMMISTSPILTSQYEGPRRGTLIFGRYLDEQEIEHIGASTQLSLTIVPYDDVLSPDDFQIAKESLSHYSPVVVYPLNDAVVASYSLLEDIYGYPRLIMRVDIARDIYAQGQASISYLVLSLLASGGIFGIVVMLLLEKTVLSRLARLSVSIRHMGDSNDLSIRVPVSGKDELADLSAVINGRLEALQATQNELQQLNVDLEARISQRTEQLQRAKDHTEAILHSTSDAIIVTRMDGKIKQTNMGFNELFGYEMDEAFGVPLLSLFERSIQMGEAMETVTNVNQSGRAEIVAIRKDGTTFDADLMLAPIRGESGATQGIVCSLRDISDRTRNEERQRALLEGLRVVVSSATELMACTDVDTLFQRAVKIGRDSLDLNRCAVYVMEAATLRGTYGTNRHGNIVPEHTNCFTLEDATWRERLHLLQSDGPQWISVNEQRMDWDGEQAALIGKTGWICITPIPAEAGFMGMFFNDGGLSDTPLDLVRQEIVAVLCSLLGNIYQRKRLEEDLRQSLIKEKELNELKSRFTSMISHEFRTPLATIQSSSDLMKRYADRMTDERKGEHLETIVTQVQRLTDMLDDILTISKAQSVGLDFRPLPTDLEDLCGDIVHQTQQNAANTHEVLFSGMQRPLMAMADGKLLRQAITNLLTNAIKYSPEGGPVYLDLKIENDQALIRVRDEGIGIPEADQARLFEIFHRANNVGNISGTGLGLAITRYAIEKHGGDISVSSEVGVGTTFTITLPTGSSVAMEMN